MLHARNLGEENQIAHDLGMAAVQHSNQEWRSKTAGDRLTENACRTGRAIADTKVGESTIGALAGQAASRHIGLYFRSSDSDSASSSSSENASNKDVTVNFVTDLRFNTNFDPYSKPKLPAFSDLESKQVNAYINSLSSEETIPAEYFESEGIKEKKTQILESSKSEETEHEKVKPLEIPKLNRTKRVDKEFFDALKDKRRFRAKKIKKVLNPRKIFFHKKKRRIITSKNPTLK